MPLPPEPHLSLDKAAEHVARYCKVSTDEAVDGLEREFRRTDGLCLRLYTRDRRYTRDTPIMGDPWLDASDIDTIVWHRSEIHGSRGRYRVYVRLSDLNKWLTEANPAPPSADAAENGPASTLPPTQKRPEPRSVLSGESRPRGRKPKKRNAVVAQMRKEIASGSMTEEQLNNMLEKELADKYEVSRYTARKARKVVLAETSVGISPN
jgi:hypothetical protein